MKKPLPCRFNKLVAFLFLVAAFVTSTTINAQTCTNPRTIVPGSNPEQLIDLTCAGNIVGVATTTLGGTNGQAILWEIISDTTGGAVFVATGNANPLPSTLNGPVNSVLIKTGNLAGQATVRLSYPARPGLGTCSTSAVTKTLEVQGTPSEQTCYFDTGTITAVNYGTHVGDTPGLFDLPGACGEYTFTLKTYPAGVVVGSNTNGLFTGLDPGDYRITIADCSGCSADSGTISLVNPDRKPLIATCPAPVRLLACDVADQDAVNAAFETWKLGFQYTGGTQPITRSLQLSSQVAPDKCGGVVTGVFSVSDVCREFDDCQSTFEVIAAPDVVTGTPAPFERNACDIVAEALQRGIPSLQVVQELFAEWVKGFTVSGGCDPKLVGTNPDINNYCRLSLTVNRDVTDKCYTTTHLSSTFNIIGNPEPEIRPFEPVHLTGCVTQAELDEAWAKFLVAIVADYACGPIPYEANAEKPDLCKGADLLVPFTSRPDLCATQRTVTNRFTLDPAPKPVIDTCVGDVVITKCNPGPEDFPPAGEPKVTSLCPYQVFNSLGPVIDVDECHKKQIRTYRVVTDCYPDGVSCEQTISWKEDHDAPKISGTEHITIPGGDEENGLCTPTTTVGGPSIPDPKYNGSTKTSIDFSQPRLGDAPTEILNWTNGTTSGSADKYFEGMGVPQRVLITGLKPGKHTLVVSMKAVKKQDDARHGYDFPISWEQAVATAANIGNGTRNELKNLLAQECDGHWSGAGEATCKSLTVSKRALLPATQGNPPNQTGIRNVDDAITCFEAQYGPRELEMETPPGTTITSLSTKFLGYTGREEGDNFGIYEFSWDSNSTVVEFKFAGHLALGGGACGYGNCHGAGDIKGNPYHIRLDAIDRAGLGSRDNQVKCEKSQTCDVNIPVSFKTPKAEDCDPLAPPVLKDGAETIVTNPDGSVTHCQKWIATDACGNVARDESCITVVCVLGANFGDLRGTVKLVGVTGKSIYNSPSDIVTPTGLTFNAYPNPFRSNFTLDVSRPGTETLNISVYDMLGKSIDQRSILGTESSTGLDFGREYPTGIYNIILNQATEQRTLRVIKN